MPFTVQDNTPAAGYIAWSNLHIVFRGVDYAIQDGNTNRRYVYWKPSVSTTVLQTSDTLPALTDEDLLVFLNKNGVHVTVPLATVVDGSLIVAGTVLAQALAAGAVTADKIAAGAVGAQAIAAGAVLTEKLAAGAVTADKISVGQLSAISADMGVLTAGRIQDAGATRGILVSGTVPTSWQRFLNLADTAQPFLHHERLSLRYDGSAEFRGDIKFYGSANRVVFLDSGGTVLLGELKGVYTAGTPDKKEIQLISPSGSPALRVERVGANTPQVYFEQPARAPSGFVLPVGTDKWVT